MAKITWNELASRQLEEHLDYALEEFGQKCVRNWYRDILRVATYLSLMSPWSEQLKIGLTKHQSDFYC